MWKMRRKKIMWKVVCFHGKKEGRMKREILIFIINNLPPHQIQQHSRLACLLKQHRVNVQWQKVGMRDPDGDRTLDWLGMRGLDWVAEYSQWCQQMVDCCMPVQGLLQSRQWQQVDGKDRLTVEFEVEMGYEWYGSTENGIGIKMKMKITRPKRQWITGRGQSKHQMMDRQEPWYRHRLA